MDIEIRPLSQDTLRDYLDFFDNVAFTDNHDWAGCYCYFNQFPGTGEQWLGRTGTQNRAAVVDLVGAGEMKGYLAYRGGRVVGWCNANEKGKYPLLSGIVDLSGGEGGKVCSIVCYVIAPGLRRQGIARLLLRRVCEEAAAAGYDCVEAYPRVDAQTCAESYHGHLEMYLSEGFAVAREQDNIRIVRKELSAGA